MITCVLDETTFTLPRYRIDIELPQGGLTFSYVPVEADLFTPGDQPFASLADQCRSAREYVGWAYKEKKK